MTSRKTGTADLAGSVAKRASQLGYPERRTDGSSRSAKLLAKLTSSRVLGALSIAAGLGIWQLVASLGIVDSLFLPKLSVVCSTLWDMISSGSLNNDLLASGEPFLIGLLLSVVLGTALGLAMGSSDIVDKVLGPWVMAINSIPRIAFVPMLVIVFGIGQEMHIAVVFITGVFPVIINVTAGVRSIDPELNNMAIHFGSGPLLRLRSITLPATVPFLLAGFRLAVAHGLIGVVLAEFFAGSSGIGFTLYYASSVYNVPVVYAMIVILGAAGFLFFHLTSYLEHRFDAWRTA